MTRTERLDYCKKRAIELLDNGDVNGAFASFSSDVSKHPETEDVANTVQSLGAPLLFAGLLSTVKQMRTHIRGYN